MDEIVREILVDETSPLFDKTGMFYKKFPSDYRQVRYYALLIIQKAPPEIKEINLLEQQVCELLRNAIKHGNGLDASKTVQVWFSFSPENARLIIEDEGQGFQNLEEWNEFNKKRSLCLHNENYEELANYVSFLTEKSDENDGGNALFAAVEYWDKGMIFNNRRNAVAVEKAFPKKRYGVELS